MSHDLSGKTPEQLETIRLLQTTVEQLQRIVNQLKTQPLESFPTRVAAENLYRNTTQLAESLTQQAPVKKTILQDSDGDTEPSPRKKPQSKTLLTIGGIISSVLVIALILANSFSQPKAQLPESSIISETPTSIEVPEEITQAPPTPIEEKAPEEAIKPKEVVKQPAPLLKPKQTLIAAIQNEVATIASSYAEGLITAVQADFRGSRLIIQMSDDWFNLENEEKQKIANELLIRVQKLNFRKLEITDYEGNALARNPVVGQNMVILNLPAS